MPALRPRLSWRYGVNCGEVVSFLVTFALVVLISKVLLRGRVHVERYFAKLEIEIIAKNVGAFFLVGFDVNGFDR